MSNALAKQLEAMIAPSDATFLNEGQQVQPAGAVGTTVTSGDNTWGAWIQVEDSLSVDSLLERITCENLTNADLQITVAIGRGAAGFEVTIVEIMVEFETATEEIVQVTLPHPVRFAAGDAISARMSSPTNSDTHTVKLDFVAVPEAQGHDPILGPLVEALMDSQQRGRYVLNPIPNGTTGIVTAITHTAGNAYANPAYSEIEDSAPVDYWIDHVYIFESATLGTDFEVDIATGAGGSEDVRRTFTVKARDANAMVVIQFAVPIFVPAATRIAVRARGSANTAFDIVLGIRTGLKPI